MTWFNDISVKKITVAGQVANDKYVIAIHDPDHFNYSGIYTVSLTNGTDTYQFDLDITGSTNPTFDFVSCKVVNIMSSAGVGITDSLADLNSNFDFNIADDGSNRNFINLKFKNSAFLGGNFNMSITNKIPSGLKWTSLVDYLGKNYSSLTGSPFPNDTLLSPLQSIGGSAPSLTVPTLNTLAATNITSNSLDLNGILDSLGSETSVTVKFVYSINSGPAITVTATSGASVTASGTFSYTLSGLSSGDAITYKIIALGLTNSGNDGSGSNLSTTVSPGLSKPTITASAATSVTDVAMTLNGNLTSLGSETSVGVYFYYRVQGSGSAYSATPILNKVATGTFSSSISGLSAATTYEFFAVAVGQTNFGNDGFSTPNLTQATTSSSTLDANSVFNITGSTTNATATALTSATVPSVTNGSITSNTVVASSNSCVSQTVEVAQQGADPDWVASKSIYQLKPKKLSIDSSSTPSSLVLTSLQSGVLASGDKLWVDESGSVKEIVLGSVAETAFSGTIPNLPYGGAKYLSYDNSGTWIVSHTAGISISRDNFNSYSYYPCTPLDEAFYVDNGVWVIPVTTTSILRSADGGSTWFTVNLPVAMSISPNRKAFTYVSGVLFCYGATSIMRSTDQGLTWTNIAFPVSSAPRNISKSGTTLITVVSNPAARYYTSTDLGATWTAQTLAFVAGAALGDIFVNPVTGTWIITTISGSSPVRSTDNGATWASVTNIDPLCTQQTVVGGTWVLGLSRSGVPSKTIVMSTDDGVTWTNVFAFGYYIQQVTYNASNGKWLCIADLGAANTSVAIYESSDLSTFTINSIPVGIYGSTSKSIFNTSSGVKACLLSQPTAGSSNFIFANFSGNTTSWTYSGNTSSSVGLGRKYTCSSITSGRVGSVPLVNVPTYAYKAGQLFQSDIYTTSSSPTFTDDTISSVSRTGDSITITCSQKIKSGANRFVAEKVTVNKDDAVVQYQCLLYV